MFDKILRVHLYKIILVTLLIATLISFRLFWTTQSQQWAALFGGTATGLLVALIQYLIQWNEHNDIEQFKRLGIRRMLAYREGKDYYERLIEGASQEILVLGNTASRFLDDFANNERDDTQALVRALQRNVRVRILVPEEQFLNESDKHLCARAKPKMEKLANDHPTFQYKYFSHRAAHSLVRIDDECLVGPIFPHVSSKNSPAIHTLTSSPFVTHYIKHFEWEWNNAK
jgi:hypothetical protein